MKFLNNMSRKPRLGTVISVIWIIIIFVFAIDASNGYYDEQFFQFF
jgi:uncharacterized membrane protein